MKKYNDILADERPEFKAANYGFDALSNTELLSMVINRGAGTAESLSQARQLMNMADNNLSNLAKLSMDEMQVVQGIGDCKALAVLAALELGKRRAVEKLGSKPDMGSSLERCNHHGICAQSPIGKHAAKQGGRCADPADSQGLSSHAPLLYGPCDSNRWSILQLSRQGQTIGTMGNVIGTRCPFTCLQSC